MPRAGFDITDAMDDSSRVHRPVTDFFEENRAPETLLEGVPIIPEGEPSRGQFFPIVSDEAA